MSDLSLIAARFASVREAGRMAFMPFVTAGDPDLDTTLAVIEDLSRRGVDLIEVGFPYSDPIADGPVIQASYQRALESGLTVDEIFLRFGELDRESTPPLVAMVSYAIVFRRDPTEFVAQAAAAGFSGMIVPDLPGDEASELATVVADGGLDLIQLVAPTTPPSRLDAILAMASGFLYCISVAGTTGVREAVPSELSAQLADLRTRTDLPLAVGFGISQAEHVRSLKGIADGAIVGSALVSQLESIAVDSEDRQVVLERVGDWISELVDAAGS
ncbi:MAG: tryptophan synthase subunit alpha [Planctomycetota bacterium]|nr:tryptophan synthase subunit alpha [Planctomycetota bacterium]